MNKRGTPEETSVSFDTRPAEIFKLRKRLLLLPILQLLALSLFTRPIFSAAGPDVVTTTPSHLKYIPDETAYMPDETLLTFQRATAYQATGNVDKAIQLCNGLMEKYPNNPAVAIKSLTKIFQIYLDIRQMDKAKEICALLDVKDKDNQASCEWRLFMIGETYYYTQDFKNARETWTGLINKYPGSAGENIDLAKYFIADCAYRLKQYDFALKKMQDYITTSKNRVFVGQAIANIYFWLDDYTKHAPPQDAEKFYQQLITEYPKTILSTRALYFYGDLLMKRQDRTGAIEKLEEGINASPSVSLAQEGTYHLALYYEKMKNDKDATASFNSVIRQNPASWYANDSRKHLIEIQSRETK